MRRGFTLVEVIVALLLFQIAMLALSAATITATRDLAAAGRMSRATSIAERRVALLRSSACAGGGAGVSDRDGIRESWRVSGAGPTRVVTDSVEVTLRRDRRRFAVVAWVHCP